MILAIDIGNTTVTLGGVRTAPQQAYSLEFTARIDINHTWSASQYESAIEQLFEDKNLSPSDFRGVIISSVVPSVLTLLQECVRNLFGTEPLLVTSESDLGMTFSIPEPEKVGRDRLVDAAWAAAHYPLPVITVDLGTATTFNVIRENSVFCGGAIAPGLVVGCHVAERPPFVSFQNPAARRLFAGPRTLPRIPQGREDHYLPERFADHGGRRADGQLRHLLREPRTVGGQGQRRR